jgi:hypothetical protein
VLICIGEGIYSEVRYLAHLARIVVAMSEIIIGHRPLLIIIDLLRVRKRDNRLIPRVAHDEATLC